MSGLLRLAPPVLPRVDLARALLPRGALRVPGRRRLVAAGVLSLSLHVVAVTWVLLDWHPRKQQADIEPPVVELVMTPPGGPQFKPATAPPPAPPVEATPSAVVGAPHDTAQATPPAPKPEKADVSPASPEPAPQAVDPGAAPGQNRGEPSVTASRAIPGSSQKAPAPAVLQTLSSADAEALPVRPTPPDVEASPSSAAAPPAAIATPQPPAQASTVAIVQPPQAADLPVAKVPVPPEPASSHTPKPEPAQVAAANIAPPPAPPAPTAEQAPVFDFGSLASDTNALVTGDMVLPASLDTRFNNRKPSYPSDAARHGDRGTVLLLIHVQPDGLVAGVDVVRSSGHPSLDDAAISAARTWHFLPAVRGGQPQAFDFPMRFEFSLW